MNKLKESNELEKLLEKFGKRFDIINIEGNFVYGYVENKKHYLGTKEEYHRYRELKATHKNKGKKKENPAYKSFKESYKSGD